MLIACIALFLGYIIGSLPSAEVMARLQGRSIFSIGSGNMGAMNTARNLGWGVGIVVFCLDIAKGALAAYLGLLLAQHTTPPWLYAIPLSAATGAVVGHAWSVFVSFRGGKALAVSFGMGLPLFPYLALYATGLLIVLILLLRKTSLASSIMLATSPILLTLEFWRQDRWGVDYVTALCFMLIMAAIGIFKHWPGILAERKLPQKP